MDAPQPAGPVLLFDGECGLCQRLVGLLLRLDRAGRLRFAPLQGPAAQAFLRSHRLPTRSFSSLVFVPDWSRRARADFRLRTDGVIGALRCLGAGGRMAAGALRLAPAPLRDLAYRAVARVRHRLFGPWRPRPPARPEWAARFLE
ncbi:MAG TPA: DCC1-like thiol-disulfide oxidoreductase family protein [Opitutaceae bacterium]|nr:DCC1-like thiol-disulfide oxidoreductase family protein [Opitutaceae bacterium]